MFHLKVDDEHLLVKEKAMHILSEFYVLCCVRSGFGAVASASASHSQVFCCAVVDLYIIFSFIVEYHRIGIYLIGLA